MSRPWFKPASYGVICTAAVGLAVSIPSLGTEAPAETRAQAIVEASSESAYEALSVVELRSGLVIDAEVEPDEVPRQDVLAVLFDTITEGLTDDQDRVMAVAAWVQSYFGHPLHTPLRPGGMGVYDPIQLLDVRMAQCGQVNRVLVDILEAGGYPGRVVQLDAHQGAEVFYLDAWHYIEGDALTGGAQITRADGTLPSALEINETPELLDGVCLGCEFAVFADYIDETIGEWDGYPPDFRNAPEYYVSGDAWRNVFSVVPTYYERIDSAEDRVGDPEYGWLRYVHVNADGSLVE